MGSIILFQPNGSGHMTAARLQQTLRQYFGQKTNWGKFDRIMEQRGASGTGKLLDALFRWRLSGNPENRVLKGTLNALHGIGLDDPFEIREELQTFVKTTLAQSPKLKTDLDKAKYLFRSLVPHTKEILICGKAYKGLKKGLAVEYNKDPHAVQRMDIGSQLPKDILASVPGTRIAQCLEFANLLIAVFRAAGFIAFPKITPDHAYAIAIIDGKKFMVDPAEGKFAPTNEVFDGEALNLSVHYSNKGSTLLAQGKIGAAAMALDLATEIDPRDLTAWKLKGALLHQVGEMEEAARHFVKCLEIRNDYDSWWRIGIIRFEQNRQADALTVLEEALKLNPDHINSRILKARALIALERFNEATDILEKIKPANYLFATSLHLLGTIKVKQKDIDGAKIYFERARTCGYEEEANELNWNDLYLPQHA